MYEDLIEKKVKSESIFDGVLLHVKRDTVELPNGKEATREWIKHPGASSVIPILPAVSSSCASTATRSAR